MNYEIKYTNSLFEQPWWLDIVAKDRWKEVLIEDNNVIARFAFVYDKGVIHNPIYTQTLGIWMDETLLEYAPGNSQLHKQKDVIIQILDQLPEFDSFSITLDNSNKYVLPFKWYGFDITPFFSYRLIDVDKIEDIRKVIGKTVIKNIKSASKKVHIETNSTDYDSMIKLQNLTYERQNKSNSVDNEFSLMVMKNAVLNNHGRLMVSYDDNDEPHSAAFYVYDENTCYYLMGGKDPKYNSDGSQNLLLYEGIEFAKTVSHNFDFEGSMVEGIENFFRQFGGSLITNYHISKETRKHTLKREIKKTIKNMLRI